MTDQSLRRRTWSFTRAMMKPDVQWDVDHMSEMASHNQDNIKQL